MHDHAFIKPLPRLFEELASREEGLSQKEAAERLRLEGPNKLPEDPADGFFRVFVRQFESPLIYILAAASAALYQLGDTVDAAIILAVLAFNAIIGAIQEGKAEKTLRALRTFSETTATVLRGGDVMVIRDAEVVRGDVLLLREGEKVPADARVVSVEGLAVNEAALTGESEPVHKTADAPAGEQSEEGRNALFKGTTVVSGRGEAVVVATGPFTAIGEVAREVEGIHAETPLAAGIRQFSKFIIIVVVLVGILLFAIGLLAGESARDMFATVVSLAVSVIPEGLPVVVTLVLALGVERMSRRHALVKKLQAVEALGQASVIAVDKTGTLTRNEMTVKKAYVDGALFEVEGVGYEPVGAATLEGKPAEPLRHPGLFYLARLAAYGSDADVRFSEARKEWVVRGDPTEAAMVVFSRKLGVSESEVTLSAPRLEELVFDYRRKYHATLRKVGEKPLLTLIGAPEIVLSHARKIWKEGKEHPLFASEKTALEKMLTKLSRDGLRVVAAASAEGVRAIDPEKVPELTFVGFFAMKDALRPEVAPAMEKAEAAGIRVVMITGDHAITAEAIGKEAGILKKGDEILTGEEMDRLTDPELGERLSKVSVYARVTPEHKLRIVQAFKRKGVVIAMTGDGVNDAPPLVAADLGVAMGKIGTEVAKEAADIVLLDDDFGSIVSAVEEGRNIYKTIKKVILYLLSTSAAEVVAITSSLAFGLPLILLPAQIIWLNLVTDSFLTLALAMEPKEPGLLSRSFKKGGASLVDTLMKWRIAVMALPMALGTLFVFTLYLDDLTKAWTIALTTLAATQWFNAFNCRAEDRSIFAQNPFGNWWLVASLALVVFLQVAAVYTPFLQTVLSTTALSLSEWGIALLAALPVLLAEEARKLLMRLRRA